MSKKINKIKTAKYTKSCTVPLTEEMHKNLEWLASDMDVNKSDVLREALEAFIAENACECEICGSIIDAHSVEYGNYDTLCAKCDTGISCISCGDMLDADSGHDMCFECYSDGMPD